MVGASSLATAPLSELRVSPQERVQHDVDVRVGAALEVDLLVRLGLERRQHAHVPCTQEHLPSSARGSWKEAAKASAAAAHLPAPRPLRYGRVGATRSERVVTEAPRAPDGLSHISREGGADGFVDEEIAIIDEAGRLTVYSRGTTTQQGVDRFSPTPPPPGVPLN